MLGRFAYVAASTLKLKDIDLTTVATTRTEADIDLQHASNLTLLFDKKVGDGTVGSVKLTAQHLEPTGFNALGTMQFAVIGPQFDLCTLILTNDLNQALVAIGSGRAAVAKNCTINAEAELLRAMGFVRLGVEIVVANDGTTTGSLAVLLS